MAAVGPTTTGGRALCVTGGTERSAFKERPVADSAPSTTSHTVASVEGFDPLRNVLKP